METKPNFPSQWNRGTPTAKPPRKPPSKLRGLVAGEAGASYSQIAKLIRHVHGFQVMLDRDLARLYGITTGNLNKAVKRNLDRFPADFMVRLSQEDVNGLIFQNGTSNAKAGRGGSRHLPYAFTEQGVAMLSSVLKSKIAIEMNISIMRAFVAMRHTLLSSAGIIQRLGAVEAKQLETDKRLDTVFDALDRGNLLPSGILLANTEFDSIRFVTRLIKSAKTEIVIIDPYADSTLLDVLTAKGECVTVRLVCKDRGKPSALEIEKFNKQYKGLTVEHSDAFHDRFVIIDNVELYNLGSSVNCLGRRLTSYTTRSAREIKKLLALIH